MSPSTFKLCEESVSITAVEGVSEALARQWMRDCGRWFAEGSPVPGAKGRMARISSPAGEVLAKRDERGLRSTVLCALLGRPARTMRAFRLGLALAETAVRTARPLALVERSLSRGKWESCLVMERIMARNLREVLLEDLPREQDGSGGDRTEVKSRLLRAVATAIARLHRASFRQRDLKAANLLVEPREGGAFEVSLIDFEGMKRFREPPPLRVRVRDLARLRVSFQAVEKRSAVDRDDWALLVAEYLRAYEDRPPRQDEVAGVLRATGGWAERKIRRNRRRRRPVT
jgi:tRNA A-37 threonylcarbamoyl transferase component Bud32